MPDNITKSALQAEKEIDNYYLANLLISRTKSEALCYLLCSIQERLTYDIFKRLDGEHIDAGRHHDLMKYVMKYCLKWIFKSCKPGNSFPEKFERRLRLAADELIELGIDYEVFIEAYSLAYAGEIILSTEGDILIAKRIEKNDYRYRVYDALITQSLKETITQNHIEQHNQFRDILNRKLNPSKGSISYSLTPSEVSVAIEIFNSQLKGAYELPAEWKFSRYSIKEFREVYTALAAIAYIHVQAYIQTLETVKSEDLFLANLYRFRMLDLINKIGRYTEIDKVIIRNILKDLTYGQYGFKNPDPALQPLIPISDDQYVIVPSLVITSSPERNLIALMNRIPLENKIYSVLKNQKEELMRKEITHGLRNLTFRFWHGNLLSGQEVPDIDLTIIDDEARLCLVCELKWFLDPAEIREVIEKSYEIARGIKQIEKIKYKVENQINRVQDILDLKSYYDFHFVVISENSIGRASVQNSSIPVINSKHLVSKIIEMRSLDKVVNWLENREYLPIENKHYKLIDVNYSIGKWQIELERYQILF